MGQDQGSILHSTLAVIARAVLPGLRQSLVPSRSS
jgi:hypothetical protein